MIWGFYPVPPLPWHPMVRAEPKEGNEVFSSPSPISKASSKYFIQFVIACHTPAVLQVH